MRTWGCTPSLRVSSVTKNGSNSYFLVNTLIDPTEFNNEIDKVHQPLTNKHKQIEEESSTLNIICKFKIHSYREKLLSKKYETQ